MEYAYGNWVLVLINIAIFLLFLKSSFKPKTKTDWRTYNLFSAFIVSLFVEMYGFPLTIYLFTSWLGRKFFNIDLTHNSGHLLNTLLGLKGDPHFSVLHILSNVFIIGGFLLIGSAWNTLYRSQKGHRLVTSGIYQYMRHPQYAGFIAIIIGFLLQWPTIITLLMAPVLIIRYIHLAKSEEKDMINEYGQQYEEYKRSTSSFLPSVPKLIIQSKNKTFQT